MHRIQKYFWIARVSARSNLAYVGEVASRVLFLGVILYIFLRLWETTYDQTGAARLGGLTLAQMLWYLTITESIMLSAPRVSVQVDEDIRTGALSMQLIRPMAYELYRLSTTLGERSVRFAINLVVGTAIASALVGPGALSIEGMLALLLTLPLAFVVDFLGMFLVGLAAFWLEDTNGLFLIYSRLVMILGGMLIPLELFPQPVQPLLRALPFSAIVYGPARLFVAPSWCSLLEVLTHQAIGALVLGVAVYAVYNRALKRVFVNGG